MNRLLLIGAVLTFCLSGAIAQTNHSTWVADNGNGTFTNPLFYEEFSDPDVIRVGDDYYMTGTTMHTMPGLPVLHSRDLVNWKLLTYAVPKLDIGPQSRLEDGKEFYGQGIWAPCIRYHEGKFYIFSNVNRDGTHVFIATNPAGPWEHKKMNATLHDLSVLFDDDGKIYAVWGYDELRIAQLSDDLLSVIPGSEKIAVPKGSGAGEGCHFYKIDGKYYITNTNYDPLCYQVCLRAEHPYGPYEVNVMSAEENFGVGVGWRLPNPHTPPPFKLSPPIPNFVGCIPMHQGGIVQIQSGEWWGWSMLDYNSVGRVVGLSPVTWKDGWPHFGLPGNLNRSPRTWVKPNTGFSSAPTPTFERTDDFNGPALKNVWQWNHVPVDKKWSLKERKGWLRLHALQATSFWNARNTLTQRGIGPESVTTTLLDATKMKSGDVAGLALLNVPYAWLGIKKDGSEYELKIYDQQQQKETSVAKGKSKVWLRVHCNFDTDIAQFFYSLDGKEYQKAGGELVMPFQLKTFQGVRTSLFSYSISNKEGGYADFDFFQVDEPRNKGLTKPIPYDRIITLRSLGDSSILTNWRNHLRPVHARSPFAKDNLTHFRVLDRGNGRIALQSISTGGFVTVKGEAGLAEVRIEAEDQGVRSTFQWQDMLKGDLMLMSLFSNRFLFVDPHAGSLCSADSPGTSPDRRDGSCFVWEIVE